MRRKGIVGHWVSVAKYDAPSTILHAITLAGAECSLLGFAVHHTTHMLEINGERKVSRDTCLEVLDTESSEVQVLRSPRKALAHVVPASLV